MIVSARRSYHARFFLFFRFVRPLRSMNGGFVSHTTLSVPWKDFTARITLSSLSLAFDSSVCSFSLSHRSLSFSLFSPRSTLNTRPFRWLLDTPSLLSLNNKARALPDEYDSALDLW